MTNHRCNSLWIRLNGMDICFTLKCSVYKLCMKARLLLFSIHVRYMLSPVHLSSVCNADAPYSGGCKFQHFFYGIWYLGHPLTCTKNFMEIVPGNPSVGGVKRKRKGKEEYLYSAFSYQGTYKALRRGSHSFTCKQHHACLSFVAFIRCHHHSN